MGLTSEAGQQLNGQTCQRMPVDKSTGRHIVRLSATDPQPAWKKLKPENLKGITAEPAAEAGYHNDMNSERCRTCWTTAEERTRLGAVMPFLLSTGPLDSCPSCGRLPAAAGPPAAA